MQYLLKAYSVVGQDMRQGNRATNRGYIGLESNSRLAQRTPHRQSTSFSLIMSDHRVTWNREKKLVYCNLVIKERQSLYLCS